MAPAIPRIPIGSDLQKRDPTRKLPRPASARVSFSPTIFVPASAHSAFPASRVSRLDPIDVDLVPPIDVDPETGLYKAAKTGNLPTLNRMIGDGSLDKLDDSVIFDVISAAGENRQTEFLYQLFRSPRFDRVDLCSKLLRKALIRAAEKKRPAVVNALLRTPLFRHIDKETLVEALYRAAECGSFDFVEALIGTNGFRDIHAGEVQVVLDNANQMGNKMPNRGQYDAIIGLLIESGKFGPIDLKNPLETLLYAADNGKDFLIDPLVRSGYLDELPLDQLPEDLRALPEISLLEDRLSEIREFRLSSGQTPPAQQIPSIPPAVRSRRLSNLASPEQLGERLLEAVESKDPSGIISLTQSPLFYRTDLGSYEKALLIAAARFKKCDPLFLALKNNEKYTQLDEKFKYFIS